MNIILILFVVASFIAGLAWAKPFKRFSSLFTLAGLLVLVLFTAGCSAAWITSVQALLPSLATIISSILAFAAGLAGKTVSAATLAKVQTLEGDISTELTDASAVITAYKSSQDQSLLGKLAAVFSNVVGSLQSILRGLDITDTATLSKLTELIDLAIGVAQAIIALIPQVLATLAHRVSLTRDALTAADKAAALHIDNFHKAVCQNYNDIVNAETANPDVNGVLKALPRL
jgi:hypothetical protein